MSFKSIGFLLLIAAFAAADPVAGQMPVSNKPKAVTQVDAPTASAVSLPDGYQPNGQTPLVNYVRERTGMGRIKDTVVFDGAGYVDVKETTTYVDGVGRHLQTVERQMTPGSQPVDIVSPMYYDLYGREAFKYLPYASNSGNASDGKIKFDPFIDQKAFYQNIYPNEQPALAGEQIYYSQTDFEASPSNRILKTMGAGNSWAGSGKGVSLKYLVNSIADSVAIWTIDMSSLSYENDDVNTNIPHFAGYYTSGQLYKNVVIDENEHATVEYKDKEGLLILKKTQIAAVNPDFSGYTGWLSTYYIYDRLNQQRFVISPKGVSIVYQNGWDISSSESVVNELCYRYEYDFRGRQIAKKIPGAKWQYLVYDLRDEIVCIQDANMRKLNQWLTTLYDALGRAVATGIIEYSGTRDQLQQYVTDNSNVGGIQSISVNGDAPSSVVSDLVLTTPTNGYQRAGREITLENGFETPDVVDFTAEINAEGGSNPWASTISVMANPIPPNSGFTPLVVNLYDDYNKVTDRQYSDLRNSLIEAGSNSHVEDLPNFADQRAVQTIGHLTATRVRIIEDPSDLSKGKWLTTVNYFDDRMRLIQSQKDNYRGGNDTISNRYTFTGKVIGSYYAHSNPLSYAIPSIRVKTTFEYDHANRLLEVYKVINDADSTRRLLSRMEYDQMGALKKRSLGQKISDASFLETLAYSYNIRGWLKGINSDYSASAGPLNDNTHWFGMELSYDWGFNTSQLNGNISGIKWKSQGDGQRRSYGFGYDDASRLLYADFNQYSSGVWDKSAGIDFSTIIGDGVDANTAYDENGNIKLLMHYGWKLGGKQLIDSLTFGYFSNTNKLKYVIDGRNEPATTLGDFRTSSLSPYSTLKNADAIDYRYDDNGNITGDLNKDIGTQTTDGVIYNHLNKPWQISVRSASGTKGTIRYIYDATGNKIEKITQDNTAGIQTATLYIGAFEYTGRSLTAGNNGPSADTMVFFGHEEGRVRILSTPTGTTAKTAFAYDYFIKDHLSNTRAVLTEEQQLDKYPAATLEASAGQTEELYYSKIPETREVTPAAYPSDTSTKSYVARLNASNPSRKIGPGIILKVMAGDQMSMQVSSWYQLGGSGPSAPANPASDLLAALISGVGGLPGGDHPTSTLLQSNSGILSDNIVRFLGDTGQSILQTRPHAFLNWVLFDNQMSYVKESSGFDQVGDDQVLKKHILSNIPVTKSGYLYVYLSNETPGVDVYFDNLQVTHTRGPLLEENHYYPFGLSMAGISSKALKENYVENRLKFNGGNELQSGEFADGTGLELYDAVNRMYDPQIGRFGQPDEFGEANAGMTPYSFADCNPIRFNDPLGLEAWAGGQTVTWGDGSPKKRKHGFTANDPNNLTPAVVTAQHTQKNLERTYWYYINNNVPLDKAPKGIQNWLYRKDRTESFLQTVHEGTREEGIFVANVASFFIPLGEIAQLARLGRVAQLFKLRRGLALIKGTGGLLGSYGTDAAIARNLANIIPKRGWYDIVVHGTEDGLAFKIDQAVVSPAELYTKILQDGYTQGTKIRLFSCHSGMLENGAAAVLSKLTESTVIAPQSWITVSNGSIWKAGQALIGDGMGWSVFKF